MIRVYGMEICPDCLEAKEQRLLLAGIDFEFLDFADSTENLKEFLKLREANPLFDEVRRQGNIGIPCFVLPSGEATLQIADILQA